MILRLHLLHYEISFIHAERKRTQASHICLWKCLVLSKGIICHVINSYTQITFSIFYLLSFFLTRAQNWASDRNHVHLLAWSLSFKLWHQIKCSSLLKMPFCCCFCRYGDLEKSVWLQSNFSNLHFSGDSSWKDYLLLTNSFPVSILELNDVVLTVNLETLRNDSKIAPEFTSLLWGLLSVLHKCKPDIIPS